MRSRRKCDLPGLRYQADLRTYVVPRQFILLLYPSDGEHEQVYTSGAFDDLPTFAADLAQRLKSFTLPVSIPFTGRYDGVACSVDWQTVGRRIRIGNWVDSYAPYELPTSALTYQQLQPVVPAIEHMRTARDSWLSLTAQQPLERRVYSADEVKGDPRFAALISPGVNLLDAIGGIRHLGLTEVFPEGRPRDDASTLWDEMMGPDDTVNIAPLLSSRTSFLRMLRLSGFLLTFHQTAAILQEGPEASSG